MALTKDDVIMRHLEEQLGESTNESKRNAAQAKKLRSCLSMIAEKVCDGEYGERQLSGKNLISTLDDIALRDFIIQNVNKQRIKFTRSIIELQKMYLQEQREKDELARQLLDEREEKEHYKKAYENAIHNCPVNGSAIVAPTSEKAKDEKPGEKNMVYYNKQPYDIEHVYNNTDVYQMSILKIIGENGYSETNDIVDACRNIDLGSETVIRDTMKLLVNNNLLEIESISTPIRRKLSLYSLTPIGIAIYKKEYGKAPVKDEKTRIKAMHATLQHGYCIKDTAKILGDLGYSDICIDSTKNAIEVANNRRYVPDIIASFDSRTKTYWEVELGHHHDNDFYEKLEKAAKITSILYIVVNDANTWEKLKKQITGYKLKLKQERRTIKLTVVLGTMIQLSKKDVFFNNPENKFVLG